MKRISAAFKMRMQQIGERRELKRLFIILLLISVVLTFSFAYYLGALRASKLAPGLTEGFFPPSLAGDFEGYDNHENADKYITFNDVDISSYGNCVSPVDFKAGKQTMYLTKPLTIDSLISRVRPRLDHKLFFAYYSPGEVVNGKYRKTGWYILPEGPYDVSRDDINLLTEKEYSQFVIPANRGFVFVSEKPGQFCNSSNLIRNEEIFVDEINIDELTSVKDGWILLPVTKDFPDNVITQLKGKHISSVWYTVPETGSYTVGGLDSLRKPFNSGSVAWVKLEATESNGNVNLPDRLIEEHLEQVLPSPSIPKGVKERDGDLLFQLEIKAS